jgi:perosamine synthetase
MIPYGRQSITQDELDAVINVLKSDYLTTGPMVEAFEQKVAAFCGVRHGVAVSSGTAALHVAVMALNLQNGDEGITSPNTFLASANCMAYCGIIPRFADIDPETYCIDPEKINKKITPATRLLLPVHFAGQVCDMDALWDLACRKNLYVIEDAAHAIGSGWTDKNGDHYKVGSCSHSHMTIFSFHPVKTITTGEGGMIMTNDDELAAKCRLLRNHGIERNPERFIEMPFLSPEENKNRKYPWYYEMQALGYNYRLTDIQAALGMVQMDRLDEFREKRRYLWSYYNKELGSVRGFGTPLEREGRESAWHLYVARTEMRNELLEYLLETGIHAHAMYRPVHLQPWYQGRYGYNVGDFPESETYFNTCIILPLYPTLTGQEQDFIINSIKTFLNKN